MYNKIINQEFKKYIPYLKYVHFTILLYLYNWVVSNNSPEMKQFENDDKFYFYIYLDKIVQDTGLSRGQVERALYRLENKDKKIQTTMQPFIYPKQVKKENRLYISLNPIMADFLISNDFSQYKEKLNKRETGNPIYIKKIDSNNYNKIKEEQKMLLDESDFKIKPKKYSDEAESIAKKIIIKYGTIFNHRLPEDGKEPTKTFQEICIKIQDLYNGNFNSRNYPLSDKCVNSKQFDTKDYQKRIKEVKGDWCKVRKLLFTALNNFQLMFDENRMPFKKDYLQNNLNLWLYDKYTNRDEPQSQFIQSFNEPLTTGKQLSENKADKIYDSLPKKAQDGGNRLVELAPKGISSGTFWENINKIVEWGKLAFEVEENIRYWATSPGDIVNLFADYCEKNNINVNCSTLDIEKAVSSNSPWVWFVKEASSEHCLNLNLCDCVTASDFNDCYRFGNVIF